MNNSDKIKDVDKITIGRLFSSLKVGQLWALIIAISTIIGLVFTLGYRFGIAESKEELFESKEESVANRYNKDKCDFMETDLRYKMAREKVLANENEATQQADSANLALTKKAFVLLISKWWKKQSFDGHIQMGSIEKIAKGAYLTDSKIIFNDSTVWVIPPEIKQIVLNTEKEPVN